MAAVGLARMFSDVKVPKWVTFFLLFGGVGMIIWIIWSDNIMFDYTSLVVIIPSIFVSMISSFMLWKGIVGLYIKKIIIFLITVLITSVCTYLFFLSLIYIHIFFTAEEGKKHKECLPVILYEDNMQNVEKPLCRILVEYKGRESSHGMTEKYYRQLNGKIPTCINFLISETYFGYYIENIEW